MPIIPITIHYENNRLQVEALIDSGAVRCFCPAVIGKHLGIQLQACPRNSLTGLGGVVSTRVQEIEIDLEHGKYRFAATVDFGEFEFPAFSFILGQLDFFDKVDVVFKRRTKSIELGLPT